MKKNIYIVCFTVLGLTFALLFTALMKLFFVVYTYDLTTADLQQFQDVVALSLFGVCGIWGYRGGKYWWHQLYELKKYKNRWSRHLKWA